MARTSSARLARGFGGVGEEQHVDAGFDGADHGLLKRIVLADGAHLEIVGDDDALEAEFAAQALLDPDAGEAEGLPEDRPGCRSRWPTMTKSL